MGLTYEDEQPPVRMCSVRIHRFIPSHDHLPRLSPLFLVRMDEPEPSTLGQLNRLMARPERLKRSWWLIW